MPESAVSLDLLRYSNSFFWSPACFIFPSNRQLIAFQLRGTVRFWISKNLSSTSELESWLTKFGKGVLVLRYLGIPTCLSRKLHVWNFFQGLNWRWYIFKCLSNRITSNFVPYIGILISWTCENVLILSLILSLFRLKNIWSIGFDSSAEVSIEMFFGNFGLFSIWFVVYSLNFLSTLT